MQELTSLETTRVDIRQICLLAIDHKTVQADYVIRITSKLKISNQSSSLCTN